MMSLVSALIGALPPGFEDEMHCPPGYCDAQVAVPPGLAGPRRLFHTCKLNTYCAELCASEVEEVWTGARIDVVPPAGWIVPEPCESAPSPVATPSARWSVEIDPIDYLVPTPATPAPPPAPEPEPPCKHYFLIRTVPHCWHTLQSIHSAGAAVTLPAALVPSWLTAEAEAARLEGAPLSHVSAVALLVVGFAALVGVGAGAVARMRAAGAPPPTVAPTMV